MKRPLALIVSAAVAAGCTAPAPSIDPFFGRSTVAPPGPGQMPLENPAAYYPGAPTAPASAARRSDWKKLAAPNRSAPQAFASGPTISKASASSREVSAPQATVPSRFSAPAAGSRVRSTSPNEDPPANKSDATEIDDREAQDTTGRGSSIRIIPAASSALVESDETEEAEADETAATRFKARFTSSRKSPTVKHASHASRTSHASFAQPVETDAELDDDDGEDDTDVLASGTNAVSRTSYGFDPDYGWVQGKLEYSQAAKQWKLRYIPIDGKTDEFGGSVVLADDSDLLSAHKTGDFVTARGAVSGRDPQGFSAIYRVETIEN